MAKEMKLCKVCGEIALCYSSQTRCIACQKALPSQSIERQRERTLARRKNETFLDKVARKNYFKNYTVDNQDKIKLYRERTKDTRKKQYRVWELKRKYGLTIGEYETMLDKQGHACAICKTQEPSTGWHIDHCHLTNKVRGILCTNCNPMLGFAGDNPDTLRNAAAYLEGNNDAV